MKTPMKVLLVLLLGYALSSILQTAIAGLLIWSFGIPVDQLKPENLLMPFPVSLSQIIEASKNLSLTILAGIFLILIVQNRQVILQKVKDLIRNTALKAQDDWEKTRGLYK